MFRAILVAALLAVFAAPASAQSARRWTDPSNQFALLIPEGWDDVPDPSANEAALLTIGSAQMRASGRYLRECQVEQLLIIDRPNMPQADVNAGMADVTSESLDLYTVAAFSNTVRDGVRVVAFEWRNLRFLHLQTIFGLPGDNGVNQISVGCIAEDPDAALDIAAMRAFINSLTFNR